MICLLMEQVGLVGRLGMPDIVADRAGEDISSEPWIFSAAIAIVVSPFFRPPLFFVLVLTYIANADE